ncbi:hypothetical protein SADUNF_Sadunf08G0068900 [Salix dunnii]|uniref:Uncharacterized protein n=1 Tax=Salix dunnii TaxID=1413687 RepID=A0A835JYA2_9ROSI|nr:hypothetical protein SADUNF_Sadunf08G0068900 [Salix dunnii]
MNSLSGPTTLLNSFNCLASSSDHAYLDMHWGLIIIRSQWSFQFESQLGSAQLMELDARLQFLKQKKL